MAQKTKVKELVGRGLNSYHTKALQQMNRIEKKNKEQNHKISILSNELDNDYLTKTEEGSVISLEHSKEGMVYLDELQGNTLVNYCVDGAKEFTLNDDINEFGTAVKLTETVDDGQVDVLAEGNTMVNVCDQQEAVAITKSYTVETGNHVALQGEFDGKARPVVQGNTLVNLCSSTKTLSYASIDGDSYVFNTSASGVYPSVILNLAYNLIPGKTYTFITNVISVNTTLRFGGSSADEISLFAQTNTPGLKVHAFTIAETKTDNTLISVWCYTENAGEIARFTKPIILEGDYTNKPIPDYFTGMQSSFEDKVVTQEMVDSGKELAENLGKYKVEYKVTGKNKLNLKNPSLVNVPNGYTVDNNTISFNIGNETYRDIRWFIKVKPGIKYTLSYSDISNGVSLLYDEKLAYGHNSDTRINFDSSSRKAIFTPKSEFITFRLSSETFKNSTVSISNVQIEEGSTVTAYEPYKEQVKTYYLNSPLLEGDTIEDNGNDVVHVHRYTKVVLDGNTNSGMLLNYSTEFNSDNTMLKVPFYRDDIATADKNVYDNSFCDKLCWKVDISGMASDTPCYGRSRENWKLMINIPLTTNSEEAISNYLQSNPLTFVLPLASPTYETISKNDSVLQDSYVGGSLDVDTAVPIDKVEFKSWGLNLKYIYPSTNYILQFESDNIGKIDAIYTTQKTCLENLDVVKGVNKFILTTNNNFNNNWFTIHGLGFNASNIVVTEATDKDFGYFSGMKSVGELEENKIEILSQNKNLLPLSHVSTDSEGYGNKQSSDWANVRLKPNTKYTLSYIGKATNYTNNYMWGIWIREQRTGKVITDDHVVRSEATDISLSFMTTNEEYYNVKLTPNNGDNTGSYLFKPDTVILEEGEKTSYVPYALNKKEILLNEPLRGLPNGVKDRFVKIGGKWFMERNCAEVVLDGREYWGKAYTRDLTSIFYTNKVVGVTSDSVDFEFAQPVLSPQFLYVNEDIGQTKLDVEAIYTAYDGNLCISIANTKLSSVDSSGFKQWLQSNPVRAIYQLKTPTYEPLEIEPTLNTYNEVTHLSNNSIIPCNMKIKNTGYNAIIKPSTLYTVALDTNKSGTIGMNLGGAKVTTTNNVATVTTPATLADDSLRLYGKGIKASKVRLLEGDKTNWIPSHFEGMKSSFEDKLQEDGSYKMEILSNDMSLFDIHERNFYMGNGASNLKITQRKIEYDADANYRYLYYDRFDFVKGKKYTIAIKGNNSRVLYFNNNNLQATGITSNNIKYVTFVAGHNAHTHAIENGERGACKVVIEDVWIYEGEYNESKHTTTKSNKIQFSSIEPLRKWDKFIFKDGRLMIERRSATFTLNSKNGYGLSAGGWENKTDVCTFEHYEPTPTAILDNTIKHYADTVPSLTFHQQWTESGSKGREGISTHQQGGFVLSIKRSKLKTQDVNGLDEYLRNNPIKVTYQTVEPTYEEIPHELQKIILEGYENGTLFLDTNIPPTATVIYAGETPIVKATKLNKTEVLNNTEDINDNIIPYLMDMDYRVVMLQLATEELEGGVSMARLFGGTFEMIKRDILSKRLTREEYGYRLADYFNAGKLTEEQVRELEDLR